MGLRMLVLTVVFVRFRYVQACQVGHQLLQSLLPISTMHAFGATGNTSSTNLLDAAEALKIANSLAGEFNAQEADAACIGTGIQDNVGALEKEVANQRKVITATHAEPERHINAVAHVDEAGIRGQAQLEGLPGKLEDAKEYELTEVNSLIQGMPWELMGEIFDWHMLMGGTLAATLLVCKWWTMVVYTSPRLWARITITNVPRRGRRLQSSVVCTDRDYLHLVLSRSRSHPLQLELSFVFNQLPYDTNRGTSSLIHGPQAANNCTVAIKLILSDQILRRCTSLVLSNEYLPFDHLNTTVLPLLSSIKCFSAIRREREQLFVESLVNLSPALRHIRCCGSLSAEDQGVGLWTKRIESYSRITPSYSCHSLHESPSLRRLEVHDAVITPITLPALQTLRWRIVSYSSLHLITAPRLHTLILCHGRTATRAAGQSPGSISFPNLRVAIHTSVYHPTDLHLFHTPALEHLSIEYSESNTSPMGFLELFDGWAHMPKPKSLYLDCTFTESGLIAVLGRLPWLEELRLTGTSLRETFWEGLTPSYHSIQQASLNGNATHILVPKLKALLVNYPTRMARSRDLQGRVMEVPNYHHHPDIEVYKGKDWMAKQASTVAAARGQAGYPLRTLACWSVTHKAEVLIGSLNSIPNRPKFVSLTVIWCYLDVLTFTYDRWADDWSVPA